MKYLYPIIIAFFICINFSHAQPEVPLVFKGIQPKWLHYSYDPKLPRFLQLYEQEGKPMIIDNSIYLLHNIFNNEQEGYLVEKLDAQTGQAQWRSSYYATKYDTRRYAIPLTQKANKIEMFYFHEWKNKKPVFFWLDSRFGRIDYCADTGIKCDSLITDLNDSLNAKLLMPFLRIDPYTRRSHLFTYHNKTQYLRYEYMYDDVKKQDYVSFALLVLDSLGHKVDTTYTGIDVKYPVYNVDLRKYQEGKYVCLIDCRKNNTNTAPKDVKLVYFDENFKVEKIVDISSILPKVVNSRIAYIDANNILLMSTTDISKNGLLYYKVSSTLLKSSGEFIESTDFNNYELSDKNYDTAAMTYLPKSKQTVLINIRKKNPIKTFDMEIIATKGKGAFELLKTLTIDDTGAMGIYDITSIGDSSLLCRYKYVDFVSKNEYKSDVKWSIWAMFPMTSLGIITSNKEVSIQNNIKYFPNPTDNFLNIQFDQEHIGKILLYNMQGQEVKSQNFLNYGKQWQISTFDLSEGFYIGQIQLGNGKIYTEKVLIKR